MTPISSMSMRLGNVTERHGKNNSMYHYNIYKKSTCPHASGRCPYYIRRHHPLERDFGIKSSAPLREGLRKFAEWYEEKAGMSALII